MFFFSQFFFFFVLDAQFLAFIFSFLSDLELLSTESAARNAKLIFDLFPQDAKFVDGLPFLCKRKDNARFDVEGKTTSMSLILEKLGLEDRDSFGSLSSSFLVMPSILRINAGSMQSSSSCFEQFFAAGRLLSPQKERSPPTRITAEQVLELSDQCTSMNELASVMLFAVSVLSPSARLAPMLLRVLKEDCMSVDCRMRLIEGLALCGDDKFGNGPSFFLSSFGVSIFLCKHMSFLRTF